jgi:photosystem II stability/assembly factor-like uncharacterized protein
MNSYILAFLLIFTVFSTSLVPDSHPNPKTEKSGTAKIVFKSTDGGQTWQDISKGLPENLLEDKVRGNSFFANDKGLFLKVKDGLYHSIPNATAPFWTKQISHEEDSSLTTAKPEIFYWGANLKKTNGTSVWSPIFEVYQRPGIRTSFETAGGAIFIGTDRGFFKTADNGKTWKQVHSGALAGHLAELDGILVAISNQGIIRSTDNGENWEAVPTEGAVVWDVKPFRGGFVATTSNSVSGTRALMTSFDAGKTWHPIKASIQDKDVIDSIGRTWNNRQNLQVFGTSTIQVGENYFCTHRNGIFRSLDKGKTWKLLLPSLDDKSFNLFVSGNVIYAVRSRGGC